jgi:YYY domain-containing protein
MRLTLAGVLCLLLLFASVGVAMPSPDGARVVTPGARATGAAVSATRVPDAARGSDAAPGPLRELPVNSFFAAVIWFLAICGIGIATLPLAYALFPYLEDRGAGFAKVLGLALATFLSSLLVRYRVFHQGSLVAWATLSLVTLASLLCFLSRRARMAAFWRERRRSILAGEVVFGLGFLLFLGLRSFNPEIYWGEKPMDFSILNILVRTRALPSSDPWLSGAPLGYYVFGQEMVAFLTLLTTLSTRFTFNLAFGLLGGTIAQGAFCLARDWGRRLRAGVAGVGFTLLLGNLSGLREWLVNQHLREGRFDWHDYRAASHLDWHYFWATSRVIRDTINEYPLWSLLFADLHAHVLALPLFLLVGAAALQLVRAHADRSPRAVRRLLSALVLGFAAALQALTNAWDVPLLLGLFVLLLVITAVSEVRIGPGALQRSAVSFLITVATFFAFLRPLWVRGGGAPGFGRNAEPGAPGVDVLTHFGFFIFLCLVWWAASASARLAQRGPSPIPPRTAYFAVAIVLAVGLFSADALCVAGILLFLEAALRMTEEPEDRLAFGFLATAFFLVLLTQRMFIYDRMNTFFKLYSEAWPLFALATAVLVFGPTGRAGAFRNWPRVLRGAFYVLLACCVFTAGSAIWGGIFGPNNPARHDARVGAPSLDGLRYLEKLRPGEYRAVLWLRRTLPGTPVVLEAQGASYQEFSRISMLTGLPTVLGWEHHVKQRGNPESEVVARREAVQEIYSSTDLEKVRNLLRRYHVGYVYVGWLERQTYPGPGIAKFEESPALFKVAYANPEAQIYSVVGGDSQDVIAAPVRETIAAPQAPAHTGDEQEETPIIHDKAAAAPGPYFGMKEPRGAAVDGGGRLWVADFGNSRLRVFDPFGGFLGGWGGRGGGTFNLREPCGVAVRGDTVYVADTWNGRVQAFTIEGKWKAAARELFGPRGITVAPDGTVWVTDTGNKRLVAFDSELKQLRTLGRFGAGPLEFSDPVGIAAGLDGSLYVADAGNQRIQIIDAEGRFARQIPMPDWKMGVEPHLDVDEDGTLYVSNPTRNALIQLDSSGAVKKIYTKDNAGLDLARPAGVAIDRKNRLLYLINSGNNKVSRFELTGGRRP